MNKCIIFSFFLFLTTWSVNTNAGIDNTIDTLKVGFYVNNIYDIDYKKGTYKISLFIWTNSYNKYYNLKDYLDVHNQVFFQTERYYEDTLKDAKGRKVYWTEIRASAEIIQKFDVAHYPFDKEKLKLSIEFTYNDYKNLFIIIDSSTVLNKAKISSEWPIVKPSILQQITYYETSFGDPVSKSYNLHTVDIIYELRRDSHKLFFKLFIALFISFMIASCSIFISNDTFEPRFSLIVGGLFGAIGNKYVTESYLPESSNFNLSDKLHFLTIFFLLILTVVTIVENRLRLENNATFEKLSFFIIVASYILCLIYFVIFT